MEIQLPYDIMKLIMNKKHQLEIEELKAANAADKNELIWSIQDMIHRNFENELNEFEENYLTCCSEDQMSTCCLNYSKEVFENERFSKIFSDMLLYRWEEYILHNDETE